jgi:hypothetical protein
VQLNTQIQLGATGDRLAVASSCYPVRRNASAILASAVYITMAALSNASRQLISAKNFAAEHEKARLLLWPYGQGQLVISGMNMRSKCSLPSNNNKNIGSPTGF